MNKTVTFVNLESANGSDIVGWYDICSHEVRKLAARFGAEVKGLTTLDERQVSGRIQSPCSLVQSLSYTAFA